MQNKDEQRTTDLSRLEETGPLINRMIRNIMVHTPYTPENSYHSATLAVFVVTLKYLDDNRDILGIEIPDILRFDILAQLVPEKTPYEQLEKYLTYIEYRMGIGRGESHWFNELVRCGLKENGEFLRVLFHGIKDMDFSGRFGRNMAISSVYSIASYMVEMPSYGQIVSIPRAILSLLDRITGITSDTRCYGMTSDSFLTISVLACGQGCDVAVQTRTYYNTVFCEMFMIISCDPNHITLLRSNIDWMPMQISAQMGTYDRVFALPPINSQMDIQEILKQSNGMGERFVEWWPSMLGSGEWIYARHMLKALSPEGVGYIVFPLGQLSRMGAYEEVREMFLRENLIDAVIEFPPGTIYRSGTKTALLIIKKNRNTHMIHFTNLGTNAAKSLIRTSKGSVELLDAKRVGEIVMQRQTVDAVSGEVSVADIIDNGCCLSPSAYIMEDFDFEKFSEDIDLLVGGVEAMNDRFEMINEIYEDAMGKFVLMKDVWHDHIRNKES